MFGVGVVGWGLRWWDCFPKVSSDPIRLACAVYEDQMNTSEYLSTTEKKKKKGDGATDLLGMMGVWACNRSVKNVR